MPREDGILSMVTSQPTWRTSSLSASGHRVEEEARPSQANRAGVERLILALPIHYTFCFLASRCAGAIAFTEPSVWASVRRVHLRIVPFESRIIGRLYEFSNSVLNSALIFGVATRAHENLVTEQPLPVASRRTRTGRDCLRDPRTPPIAHRRSRLRPAWVGRTVRLGCEYHLSLRH